MRRERGIDVLQGCNPPDLIFLVAWALRPFGVAYVFDHHDVCPELYETKFGRAGASGADAALRVADLPQRHGLDRDQRQLRRIARGRGGMDPADVFVVRSAPRTETFAIRPPSRALKRGFAHLIGYVGVIGQQEGLDLLVAAADHLIRGLGRADVHFAIIGFGPHLPVIEADVRARGLGAHFTFTGPQYGEDLLAWLNTADICVSPDPKTAMNDISTMNKVIEYMTLSKPIVQFDLHEGRASAGEAALYARANDPVDFAAKIAAAPRRPGAPGGDGRDRPRPGRGRALLGAFGAAPARGLRPRLRQGGAGALATAAAAVRTRLHGAIVCRLTPQ